MKKIGDLETRISIAETYNGLGNSNSDLTKLHKELASQTDSLRRNTASINDKRYTKEGFPTESLVNQWVDAVLQVARGESQISVLNEWKKNIDASYKFYAPVG